MESLNVTLRQYPELALFLTLAVGFYIGRFKICGCSNGSVTGVLLTGLVIGQIDIPISPAIKSVFFLLFLFAVGPIVEYRRSVSPFVSLSPTRS
jgi:putative transport protein